MQKKLKKLIQVPLLIVLGSIFMAATSIHEVLVRENETILLDPANKLEANAWQNRCSVKLSRERIPLRIDGEKIEIQGNYIVINNAERGDAGTYEITVMYTKDGHLKSSSCLYYVSVVTLLPKP